MQRSKALDIDPLSLQQIFPSYAGRTTLNPAAGTQTNPIAFFGTYANSVSAINLGFTSKVLVETFPHPDSPGPVKVARVYI